MYIQTHTFSHTKTNNVPDMHMDMNKSMKITKDIRATYASNMHPLICKESKPHPNAHKHI